MAIFIGLTTNAAQGKNENGWGTCSGCAPDWAKAEAVNAIVSRFGSGFVGRQALCYAKRESGLNRKAVSVSDDHGLAQFHRASYHAWINWNRLNYDTKYNVDVFWSMSTHATDFSPWRGGVYSCPRGDEGGLIQWARSYAMTSTKRTSGNSMSARKSSRVSLSSSARQKSSSRPSKSTRKGSDK